MIFEEVCCNTPASMESYIVGPSRYVGASESLGDPSAGDYERIVVMLRRHPSHFPDLAIRKFGVSDLSRRTLIASVGRWLTAPNPIATLARSSTEARIFDAPSHVRRRESTRSHVLHRAQTRYSQ